MAWAYALGTRSRGIIQALGLDQGESHLPVQQGVVGQVDLLLPAFAQEALHLVSAISEGGGLGWSGSSSWRRGWSLTR